MTRAVFEFWKGVFPIGPSVEFREARENRAAGSLLEPAALFVSR